jgi:thioredoxin-like negative regulator of GroEL
VWRSLVAHLLWEQGVAGSNPVTPTLALGGSRLSPDWEARDLPSGITGVSSSLANACPEPTADATPSAKEAIARMRSGLTFDTIRSEIAGRRFSEARELLNALPREEQEQAASLLVRALVGLGHNREAEFTLAAIPDSDRPSEDFRRAVVDLTLAFGTFTSLWRRFSSVFAKGPIETARCAAIYHLLRGDWPEAREQIHLFLSHRDDLEVKCWQGYVTLSQGWIEEGLTTLRHLCETEAAHPLPSYWLVSAKASALDREGVLETVRSNLARFSYDWWIWTSAINALNQVGETVESDRLLTEGEDRFPWIAWFRLQRAENLLAAGDRSGASTIVKNVLDSEPLNAVAHRIERRILWRRFGPAGVLAKRISFILRARSSIQRLRLF